ncbi:MAG: aquaporin [Armatimonadota bacterium]
MYGIFHDLIAVFEVSKGVVRGGAGSELSAMVFGEYFPNPGMLASTPALSALTMYLAMMAEILGTVMLSFVIFAVTDDRNTGRPTGSMTPLFIGLTVSLLISILAPISQAGFNPARDFGPRLVAYMAGWGTIAIPGPHGGFFTVYILAPCIGALLGGGIYQFILRRTFPLDRECTLNAESCE